MAQRWTVKAHDVELIQSIQQTCNVSPVVAQILAVRGITHPEEVRRFLDLKMTGLRPPLELPGMERAVTALHEAIVEQRKIYVYGDYDADGMTSTAILVRCIKLLGGKVAYYVPNRLDDGYGLNRDTVEKLHQRGAELIVTVDCGINSLIPVQRGNELGVTMVVTDHHMISGSLPDAAAIVHPALPGYEYPFHGLCGAGVVPGRWLGERALSRRARAAVRVAAGAGGERGDASGDRRLAGRRDAHGAGVASGPARGAIVCAADMSTSVPSRGGAMHELLGAWDWEEPVDAEHVPSGLINRTFWVRGESGRVLGVLQGLNTKVFRPVVHHDIAAVTEHVAHKGLVTPRLVLTRAGDLWHTDTEGGVWRRMTVVGDRTIDKLTDASDARSAGALVGRWLVAVQDLAHDFQMVRPDVHDTQRHVDGMRAAVQAHPGHRLHAEVAALADEIVAAWERWEGPSGLPSRVVHGDLKISNLRFEGHEARAIIDLDTCARRTLDVEIGDAMRSWCNPLPEDSLDARFEVPLFAAAMAGFAEGTQGAALPTDEEWDAFVPCTERIALELACRFAKDALEEAYFGWDERFGGRGEHNLVRARGQARLGFSIADQRGAAEHVIREARGR